jgi:hypothetical protein
MIFDGAIAVPDERVSRTSPIFKTTSIGGCLSDWRFLPMIWCISTGAICAASGSSIARRCCGMW